MYYQHLVFVAVCVLWHGVEDITWDCQSTQSLTVFASHPGCLARERKRGDDSKSPNDLESDAFLTQMSSQASRGKSIGVGSRPEPNPGTFLMMFHVS